jgi:hypothetical protein
LQDELRQAQEAAAELQVVPRGLRDELLDIVAVAAAAVVAGMHWVVAAVQVVVLF